MADKNKKRKSSSESVDDKFIVNVGNPTNDRMIANVGNPTNDRMFDITTPRQRVERELSRPTPTMSDVEGDRVREIMGTPSKGSSTIFGTPVDDIVGKSTYSGEKLTLSNGGEVSLHKGKDYIKDLLK